MERIRNTVSKNFLLSVYVSFLIGFTSFSIRDVKEIITDYIEDNRLTVVKARNSVEDGFPFLDNPSVYLIYDQPVVAGLTWSEFIGMLNDSWHQRDIAWPRNLSESKRSLSRKVFDMIKFTTVKDADNVFSAERQLKNMADILQVSAKVFISLVDTYIQNSENIDLIRNTLSDIKFRQRFIESDRGATSKLEYVRLLKENNILQLMVVMSAYVVDDMLAFESLAGTQFALDRHNLENKNDPDFHTSPPKAIEVLVQLLGALHQFKPLSTKTVTGILFEIMHSEVLDSKRFPPCTTEFKNEEDCLLNRRRRGIERICRCKKFSSAVLDRSYTDNDTICLRKPICTMLIYEKCRRESDAEFSRQEKMIADTQVCKPCATVTNSLSKSVDENPIVDNSLEHWYSYYTLQFERKKTTYLLFEEKPQFNFSQLVSQIGGSLGLYVGFSMISILQLISFFYRMCQQRQRRNSAETGQRVTWKQWRERFSVFLLDVGRILNNTDGENGEKLRELKGMVQKLERDVMMRLDNLERKMEQLLFCSQGGSQGKQRIVAQLDNFKLQDANCRSVTTESYHL